MKPPRSLLLLTRCCYTLVLPVLLALLLAQLTTAFDISNLWAQLFRSPSQGAAALIICTAFSALLTRLMMHINISAVPDHRSSHAHPTPLSGGVAVYIILMIAILAITFSPEKSAIFSTQLGLSFAASITLMALLGFIDDWRTLPASLRGAAQIIAALLFIMQGVVFERLQIPFIGTIELGYFAAPLSLLWILFFTNAFNFMDGLNGLAGNGALVGCFALICFSPLHNHFEITLLATALAIGLCGFLLFNFPSGNIFMGDIGSQTIGLTLSLLAILVSQGKTAYYSAFALPAVLFPFIFDTAFTLVLRLCQGKNIFKPHKEYLFHRLIRRGWRHHDITLFYTILSVLYGFSAGLCMLFRLNVAYVIFMALAFHFPFAVSLVRTDRVH